MYCCIVEGKMVMYLKQSSEKIENTHAIQLSLTFNPEIVAAKLGNRKSVMFQSAELTTLLRARCSFVVGKARQ